MDKKLAPITVFCYNRVDHLKRTLDSLAANELANESDVIVFSDGAKGKKDAQAVSEVRTYLSELADKHPFGSLKAVQADKNKGLANSIIDGVTSVIQEFGKIIVVEDDIESGKYFLTFMNDALNLYQDKKSVGSIAPYVLPNISLPKDYKDSIFLSQRPTSMTWASWQDRWEATDFELKNYHFQKLNPVFRSKINSWGNDVAGRLDRFKAGHNNSWAVRFTVSRLLQNQYAVHPYSSLVRNIGLDSTGTNSQAEDFTKFNVAQVLEDRIELPTELPPEDARIHSMYKKEYRRPKLSAFGEFIVVALLGIKKDSAIVKTLRKVSHSIRK